MKLDTAMRTSSATGRGVVTALGVLALLPLAGPGIAAPRVVVPESLRLSALSCLAEALKLCPNALAAKDHGVACVLSRRRDLSRRCQGLADQALRFVNGQDVHIDLRPRPRR